MSLKIIQPGALTTVQDLGRTGYLDQGIQSSGAADAWSMQAANLLVGNDPGEAVLETTMLGPEICFQAEARIALTGADMSPQINGRKIPLYESCSVRAGDVLKMGFAVSGCRCYLAVAGGFLLEPVLGSCSTNLKCGIGGFQGRALRAGDILPLKEASVPGHAEGAAKTTAGAEREGTAEPGTGAKSAEVLAKALAAPPWRLYHEDGVPVLRVVPGPQQEYFTEKGQKTFVSSVYKLTNDSNRMACRLEGEAIEFVTSGDIVSDGIVNGSVQVSSNGMPIVMLADHQTTGGYAKIGTVASVDLPVLAQKKPGEKLRFAYISVEEAQKLYIQQKQYFRKWRR